MLLGEFLFCSLMVFVMLCTLSGFDPDPRAPAWVKVLGTLGPVAAIVYFAVGAIVNCMKILYTLAEAQAAAG